MFYSNSTPELSDIEMLSHSRKDQGLASPIEGGRTTLKSDERNRSSKLKKPKKAHKHKKKEDKHFK